MVDARGDRGGWTPEDAGGLIRRFRRQSAVGLEHPAVQAAVARLRATTDRSGAQQSLQQFVAISGSSLQPYVEGASGPPHDPRWSVQVTVVPRQRNAATRRPEPLTGVGGAAAEWSAKGVALRRRDAVAMAAQRLLDAHLGEMAMCCADWRVEVPVSALGEAVMSTLGVTVVLGADQPSRVFELAAVEEMVGCDGEGFPTKVVQFYFPLARTVLLYERDAPQVDFILLHQGITKVFCDKASDEAGLELTIAEPVVDLQRLFVRQLPQYEGQGPPSLLRMAEAMFLGHAARLIKEPEAIYTAFDRVPLRQLSQRHIDYSAFDAVCTGEIFLWLRADGAILTDAVARLVFGESSPGSSSGSSSPARQALLTGTGPVPGPPAQSSAFEWHTARELVERMEAPTLTQVRRA